METRWKFGIALVLALSLSACSGSRHGDDEEAGSDETVAQDAGTDAVPRADLESLPDADKPADSDLALDSLPEESKKDAPAEAPVPEHVSSPVVASGDTTDYTVQTGDTLMKIAFETYGDLYQWRKIYDLNRDKIPNLSKLSKGTVLKVERTSGVAIDRNGEKYLIKAGDTLGSISDDVYGTRHKWKKLHENNRQMIKDPNKIYAGFYLYYQMSEEDQRQKQEFIQKKGAAPLASGAGAPPANAARAPSAAPGK